MSVRCGIYLRVACRFKSRLRNCAGMVLGYNYALINVTPQPFQPSVFVGVSIKQSPEKGKTLLHKLVWHWTEAPGPGLSFVYCIVTHWPHFHVCFIFHSSLFRMLCSILPDQRRFFLSSELLHRNHGKIATWCKRGHLEKCKSKVYGLSRTIEVNRAT